MLCSNENTEKLVTDKRINFFTFIGSAKVGWYLRSKLAPGTRCALEHGGAAPVIVERDTDIDAMIPLLAKGGLYHAGQVCVSVQRVFVHEDIADEVAGRLVTLAEKMVVGDPIDEKTDIGPLILPDEVDRVEKWVKDAVDGGADLRCGGERISDTCYKPTILINPPADALDSTEEIFGPVICIYSYSDREKAIAQANELDVHFHSAIFTKNIDNALDAVKKLNATAVMVNDLTAFRVVWMPFGGRDDSGNALWSWLSGQFIVMAFIGVILTIGLMIIGVPLAFVLGIIAGLSEFIPIIGPWIGAVPGIILATPLAVIAMVLVGMFYIEDVLGKEITIPGRDEN